MIDVQICRRSDQVVHFRKLLFICGFKLKIDITVDSVEYQSKALKRAMS